MTMYHFILNHDLGPVSQKGLTFQMLIHLCETDPQVPNDFFPYEEKQRMGSDASSEMSHTVHSPQAGRHQSLSESNLSKDSEGCGGY